MDQGNSTMRKKLPIGIQTFSNLIEPLMTGIAGLG